MERADVTALRAHLARAEPNVERYRLFGNQEKYLEAFFLVESLESRLDALTRQQRDGSGA